MEPTSMVAPSQSILLNPAKNALPAAAAVVDVVITAAAVVAAAAVDVVGINLKI